MGGLALWGGGSRFGAGVYEIGEGKKDGALVIFFAPGCLSGLLVLAHWDFLGGG